MKNELKELFTFSSGERRGIIILSLLIFLVLAINILSPGLFQRKPLPLEAFHEDIRKFIESEKKTSRDGYYTSKKEVRTDSGRSVIPKKTKLLIDINNADSASLIQLSGIGPVFASRIVAYRNKLGGFIHLLQLFEVYGMDSSRYSGIQAHIRIDNTAPRKIKINAVEFRELLHHPYFEYEDVQVIFKHRRRDSIRNLNELRQLLRKNKEWFTTVDKYLDYK